MEPIALIELGIYLRKKFRTWNKRRKARREGMALDTGLRTSTNTAVGTSLFGSIAVQLIQLLPYPELVAALTTPEAVILWGSIIAWIVARISRTPVEPGKL